MADAVLPLKCSVESQITPGPGYRNQKKVVITIDNFESRTDPGPATIVIYATVRDYSPYSATKTVQKETKPEQFRLLYFTANPPYLITNDDRKNFKLAWNAIKAERAVL